MRDFTKGVVAACAVALVCREAYAKGYNKANRDIKEKLELVKAKNETVENKKEES